MMTELKFLAKLSLLRYVILTCFIYFYTERARFLQVYKKDPFKLIKPINSQTRETALIDKKSLNGAQ